MRRARSALDHSKVANIGDWKRIGVARTDSRHANIAPVCLGRRSSGSTSNARAVRPLEEEAPALQRVLDFGNKWGFTAFSRSRDPSDLGRPRLRTAWPSRPPWPAPASRSAARSFSTRTARRAVTQLAVRLFFFLSTKVSKKKKKKKNGAAAVWKKTQDSRPTHFPGIKALGYERRSGGAPVGCCGSEEATWTSAAQTEIARAWHASPERPRSISQRVLFESVLHARRTRVSKKGSKEEESLPFLQVRARVGDRGAGSSSASRLARAHRLSRADRAAVAVSGVFFFTRFFFFSRAFF